MLFRSLHVVGMFLSGDPLRSPGRQGEQQRDASFMLWFNADDSPVDVVLPDNDWVTHGEVVLSTDPDLPHGTGVAAGKSLTLGPLTVVVVRQT